MTDKSQIKYNILLLNGPNLNMLGRREPDIYGSTTLAELERQLTTQAPALGCQLCCHQSNGEHQLIDWVQQSQSDETDFIIINPAAFTHTSIALRDAFAAAGTPFIEVHLSNVHARESFRQQSYFSDLAIGVLCGFGPQGYELALQAAVNYLTKTQAAPLG